MPIIKSAVKRMRQATTRRNRNNAAKTAIKKSIKALNNKASAEALSKAQSELDKAVKKGLIKKNTASRRKANLAKLAKEAGVKLTKKAKTEAKAPAKAPAKKASSKTSAKTAKPATKKAPAKKASAKK